MNKILFFSIFILLLNPILSYGQETKGIDKNLENISGQFAECAAYYRLVYHALISSNEPEANSYRELEDTAILYSRLLANEGRNNDLALKITNSRIEMYINKMKQESNNRNENISILINKYDFKCEEALEEPERYIQQSMDKTVTPDYCITAYVDKVEFNGIITQETFPGRPNYESIERGDEAETYWFLTVNIPLCVSMISLEDEKTKLKIGDISIFQLVLNENQYEQYETLVSKNVLVNGKVVVGMTGHYHAPAAIEVSEMGALIK